MTARLYVSIDRSGLTPRYIASPHMHPGAREWIPRDAVRVKPLEWGHGEAHCPLGVYKIDSGQASGGGRWWSWALNPDESDPFFMWQNANNADSEEAAKAAAQADFEARILSALPAPPGAQEEGE
jgi:hypothetical protein